MCGICGIIDFKGNAGVEEKNMRMMCGALRHRGPDDGGIYSDTAGVSAWLGHRRLSIIDLSQAGHQPMSNEDGTVMIVFNGEIYNYPALRSELINKGHTFKSNTDTETVLHLYEEYSEECVKYLRGMFAFAVWDRKKKSLLLARDRVGKKPLLYSHSAGIFCFASEFLSLLSSGVVKKEIHLPAIDFYLSFGYIPAPMTIYRDVLKLPPAHLLLLKDGKINIKKYWELDYSHKLKISEQDAAGETLRLLKEAVSIRMHSDVPLGAFLSGGIDSSAVVALMSGLSADKVKTFSIGFEEQDYSELEYARAIAQRFSTDHHEFIVKPKALEILPLLVERYGEPYADSSCIPTYYVSQQTRQYVTVALNGDGGDELFAGYDRYQAMLVADVFQNLPYLMRKSIEGIASILPDSVDPKNKLRRIKRFFSAAGASFQERYFRWVSIYDAPLKEALYSGSFRKSAIGDAPLEWLGRYLNCHDNLNTLDRLLQTDTYTYLPYDLLVKVDISSMANSLEARSPFLDHNLMEFAAKLPVTYKIKDSFKKYILKESLKDLLPAMTINRTKMGFGVPVGEWFRKDLKGFVREILLSMTFSKRGYFKQNVVKSMLEAHISGLKDYSFQIWALLMLELWHQRFMD